MSAPASVRPLMRRGMCHVLGDDIPLDDGIIPRRFSAGRVTDARLLQPHLFESLDPDFAARVKPGDILLAGRNFACGKPRLQGFIAMQALGLSIICASMPGRMIRRAVARSIPVLITGVGLQTLAVTGDEVEVDFATGEFRNHTSGLQFGLPRMPGMLCDIVAGGGSEAALKAWLERHPEQALQAPGNLWKATNN